VTALLIDGTQDCRLAPGKPDAWGYGRVSVRGKQRRAHVVAWEQASGTPVPDGMCVCHVCDVRNCVQNEGAGVYVMDGVEYPRFGHLWLGTRAENLRDMRLKGRQFDPPHPSGSDHYSRREPDRVARGEAHWSRRQPALARASAAAARAARSRRTAGVGR
jgi:hypothetical protein